MSDFPSLFQTHLAEHQDAIAKLSTMSDQIAPLAEAWLTALKNGKKIIFFGNGGSAADAQHLAAELVVRYRVNRPALAGLALTTDTSILTAHSNDFGFETVFSRQIEALAQPGDVALGISTSGTSSPRSKRPMSAVASRLPSPAKKSPRAPNSRNSASELLRASRHAFKNATCSSATSFVMWSKRLTPRLEPSKHRPSWDWISSFTPARESF
jgi:phosphoheptose isomerase